MHGDVTQLVADQTCDAEAMSAGWPPGFSAFLATSSDSALGRFSLDGPPWARRDGALLSERNEDLASGSALTGISVTADGLDYVEDDVWTGAFAPSMLGETESCTDWTTNQGIGAVGNSAASGNRFFHDAASWSCDAPLRVYCFQQ